MRRWIIRIVIAVFVLILIGLGGFALTWSNPIPAQARALAAMQTSATVSVTDSPGQIVFMPATAPKAGFIFYQGARVAPAAYAASMRAIAEQGYAVFVPKLPLNMALLGTSAADGIIAANPAIKVWAIGGHSLGGVAASSYASGGRNPALRGLILYASYPAASMADNTSLAIVSISGSNDGLSTPAKITAARALLPPSTKYVIIDGGNHGQFGDYGPQDGDNPAAITAEQQTAQIVAASVALLQQISVQTTP